MRIHRRKRKGVVLLICLSILVLFLLIAVTFLIVSGQYLSGAKVMARHDRVGDLPQKDTEMAFYQAVVGPRPLSRSALRGHELLRDLYGTAGVAGVVNAQAIDGPSGGQFVRVNFTPAGPINPRAGYYNGRVFTMLNGPAAGVSTRVVDFSIVSTGPTVASVLVEMFETDSADLVVAINGNTGLTGFRCLINGAAFNGTGFGYDPTTGNLDQQFNGLPVCLLPHFAAYFTGVPETGGANESYDAVDFQNMHLARNIPTSLEPSFHRTALVRFWANYYNNLGTPPTPDQIRQFVLRPLPFSGHHPQFTGSTQNAGLIGPANAADPTALLAALVNGPWDVDNDGDGIADSIWLDLDLPLKTTPEGRRYKPLVAFLIQDLDGRLNLNAHGSIAHLDPAYSSPVSGPWAGGASPVVLPRGLGYGPADIAFGHIMGTPAEFLAILNGRFGPDGGNPRAGLPGTNDPLSAIKTFDIPPVYAATVSAYASPPDVWGRGAMAIDFTGHPHYPFMDLPAVAPPLSHVHDDPYELNLSQTGSQDTGAFDAPYTIAELERVLRAFDVDAPLLPSRMASLGPVTFNQPIVRRLITTESRHIPVPNVVLPAADRASSPPSPHISDLFAVRLAASGLSAAQIETQLRIMLPAEMYHGQKFNVNRLLGNGRDDNLNFIVDEPAERDLGEDIWPVGTPFGAPSIPFNYTNNDPYITNPRFAPQIYARHLYCLMMLLVDQGYTLPLLEGIAQGTPQARELTARRIAQWAINVVDFRDADSIMSPFEYDVDPFNGNGWGALDGDPTTDEAVAGVNSDRRIVWGCEFPDLIITETKAFHDRRVKDTNFDTTGRRVGMAMGDDNDVDQFAIPQGSLFIELYCPRNYASNNPLLPRELYRPDNRLDLARLTPPSAVDGVRHPVWRIAITQHTADQPIAGNAPFARATLNPDTTSFDPPNMALIGAPANLPIERYVWFTNQNPAGFGGANGTFYNSLGWDVGVAPGQYAVVGPRANTHLGSIETDGDPITTPYDGPAPQRITLLAAPGPQGTRVVTQDVTGAISTPPVGSQVQPAIGIVADMAPPATWTNVNRRVGLNVTEPLATSPNYYPEPNEMNDGRVPADAYDDPLAPMNTLPDTPLDSLPGHPLSDYNMIATRSYPNIRSAFLQRLANPTEPWHPLANPYISIDWATIDCTVFTGYEDTNRQSTDDRDLDPNDPPEPGGAPRDLMQVRTRERGEQVGGNPNGNIWSPYAVLPAGFSSPAGDTTRYFDYNLINTLGYLNVAASAAPRLSSPPAPAGYAGSPGIPFPQLVWFNRPFATPLELMQVPASSPSRLLWEYSVDAEVANPYDPTGADFAVSRSPYTHLLNFFEGSRQITPTPFTPLPLPPAQAPAHFYRLFDFVETPSPFVGTERWYNPVAFAGAAAGTSVETFRPPYNRLSRFRDPGRINLNTIFDQAVFEGLMKGYQLHDPSIDGGTFWGKFQISRQGYEGQPPENFPTDYANPFRSAASADLGPPGVPKMRRDGVEATLLRSDFDASTGFSPLPQPLFGYKPDMLAEVPYAFSRRSSEHRYHSIQRLANLTSTHSNVYAIWITVGYFEVVPNPGGADAVHPDGYQLGQEIGIDNGTVKRHRAFYVFDRSIPVAFEPGENHNVDRAVLLKRFIE